MVTVCMGLTSRDVANTRLTIILYVYVSLFYFVFVIKYFATVAITIFQLL